MEPFILKRLQMVQGTYKTEYITFNEIHPYHSKSKQASNSSKGKYIETTTQVIYSKELNLCYDSKIKSDKTKTLANVVN